MDNPITNNPNEGPKPERTAAAYNGPAFDVTVNTPESKKLEREQKSELYGEPWKAAHLMGMVLFRPMNALTAFEIGYRTDEQFPDAEGYEVKLWNSSLWIPKEDFEELSSPAIDGQQFLANLQEAGESMFTSTEVERLHGIPPDQAMALESNRILIRILGKPGELEPKPQDDELVLEMIRCLAFTIWLRAKGEPTESLNLLAKAMRHALCEMRGI